MSDGADLSPVTHPVAVLADRLDDRLSQVAQAPTWSMTPDEQRRSLRSLARATARLEALRLRVLAEADRSGATAETGAATAADWVSVECRQVRAHARADLSLARSLEEHPLTATAMSAGDVDPAQGRAIVKALQHLPATTDPAQARAAEEHLVGLARHHDARELAALGAKILEVIAPEIAEAHEARVLEAQELAAERSCTLTLRDDDEGRCHGRFTIPSLHGQVLRSLLLALTGPPAADDPPADVRRGLALCDLLERLPADVLPHQGGTAVAVVVTMTLDQLMADLDAAGVCTLDTGGRISAAEARRLACRLGVIPAVLGGASQVLDLGRRSRFHTQPQRIAMGLRDGGCTAADCDKPPALCHAHHEQPWSRGGPTSVDNGRLLCGHHHRRLHDPTYLTTQLPGGKVAFHRRT